MTSVTVALLRQAEHYSMDLFGIDHCLSTLQLATSQDSRLFKNDTRRIAYGRKIRDSKYIAQEPGSTIYIVSHVTATNLLVNYTKPT